MRRGKIGGLLSGTALFVLALTGAQAAWGQETTAAANRNQARLKGQQDIEEIVVTASGFQQNIVEAPASITVVPRIELEQQRTNSLAEALSTVQGIDVGGEVGKTGGVNISIRGMPSDYSLILVDGRRQNPAGNVTPNGFGETASSFIPPVSAIERIEVVRGPMSTLYGSDAMGGVVNIITRTPRDRWGGDVSIDGTFQEDTDFGNSYSASAYLDGPLVQDRLALAVRGRVLKREKSELVFTDANGEQLEVDPRGPSPVEADIWSAGGRLTFMPNENHRFWLDADIARQTYDNSEGQLGTLGVRGYGPELEFNRDQFVLAHTWNLLGGVLDSDITLNQTETVGRVIPSDVPGTDREAGDPRELEATNTIFNTKYFRTIGSHTLTVGGQYWDAEMVDGVAPEKFTHEQWALYAEDEWRLLDPLALTVGVRYDDHNVFGGHVSPRAYLVWNATDAFTVKGGVSRGFKTPRLDQIAEGIVGFTGQGTIPLLGSPNLQPETSTSYETGVYFDNGGPFTANATVFYNEFDDKITTGAPIVNCSFGLTPEEYGTVSGPPGCVDAGYWPNVATFSQSVNVDKAETRGFEAAARLSVTSAVSVSANYTYTDSEQKSGPNEGLPLVATPKHAVNARIDWDVADAVNLWLRGEYRSERYRGAGEEQDQLGNFKAYSLFHLGGAYRVTENITIYNLFDKNFVDYVPYTSGDAVAYANEYAINQEPRRLWVSVNATF